MPKRYFRLRIGKPEINGEIVEVDMSRAPESKLRDYISSYSNKNDNLSFKSLGTNRKGDSVYQVTCPRMKFTAGGGATTISPAASPGWYRDGKDIVTLCLTTAGELKPSEKSKKSVYIDEITKQKATSLKKDEFNYSMQQLWIDGM